MYNKPRSRLTLARETNLHTTNSLASLQIVPTVSSSNNSGSKQDYSQSSVFSRHTQQFDKTSVQPQDQVIFRPTQILPSDVSMKRYNQQEKVPIHFRSNKKQIVPAAASAHDLSTPPDIVQDVEECGRSSRSSSHLSPNTQKAPAFLPGDRVIFAESPSAPGIPVVYRTPEERSSNPDRLNLDRRKLTVCPILEGEEQLRLLNYQHNMINKIQHLSSLKRLIFLDLYDNQIEEISGLSALRSLRVLMLGKNRIKKIENLDTLFKLDVLDLHGNQISNIENLNHLSELRVLNLAGNHIVHVDNLSGMDSLAELNLRRNKIRSVVDVDNLPSLQRLFLSFNEISSFEDIACLGESTSLSEISLDGNPIAQEQYYKQIVLRHMQQLKQLDMKRVTDITGPLSSNHRSRPFNPLYHLMSMPAFKSGLVSSGTVIPVPQNSQTDTANENSQTNMTKENSETNTAKETSKSVASSTIKPKPSSGHFTSALQTTQLSAFSGDITSLQSDENRSGLRKHQSGKPRFMTVKSTNWAVNTTVASKASSVTSSVVQASQQRQALQTNKTGIATKPQFSYTMYRSYSSEQFNTPKLSMTKHALNLRNPLSVSPMFTLSPVENNDERVSRYESEPSVDQMSDSLSRPTSEYIKNADQVSDTTDNTSRPVSEYTEASTTTLSDNVIQGKQVFVRDIQHEMSDATKMNTEQEGQTSFVKSSKNSPDIELVQEKSEKLKPFWKLIDNKIVRVTYTEEQIENTMVSTDRKKIDTPDMTSEKNNIEAVKTENENKLNQDKDKELDNVETTPPKAKYDVSITRSFYKQSNGVDQVTMIIPKRDDEKHNGKDKTAENGNKLEKVASCQLPVIKMNQMKSTEETKHGILTGNSKLKTSESLPNLWKATDLVTSGNVIESKTPASSTQFVNKSKEVQNRLVLVKEPPLLSLTPRSEKLTIFKESPLPVQPKNNMDTIPETENGPVTSEISSKIKMDKKPKTGLSKSMSAPSLSEHMSSVSTGPVDSSTSPSSSGNQSMSTSSPTSPLTPTGNNSNPLTLLQPDRKNSGTTMGQSVVKQSYKATPPVLTCSAVFPKVVAPTREEERRIALVMARKEEEKKRDVNKTQILKEKKRLAINNAKRQWEVMQGNMIHKTGKLSRTPDLYANHVGSIPNSELISPDGADENIEVESINRKYRLRNSQSDEELSEKQSSRGNSRPSSSHSSIIDLPDVPKERPRTSSNSRKVDGTKNLKETIIFGQGDQRSGTDLNNLADLEGDTLTLYGTPSLEALDRNWGMQAAGAVTHIIFKFIDFEDIAKQLYKVRTKFPGVQTLTFSATNIKSYQQINALSSVRRFDNLIIENEGNPVTKFTLWRTYVVFRLAHFALKKINDMEVTAADIVNAEKLYGPVSHITTSQLPQARLLSLVGEARRKQVLSITEDKSKKLLEGKLDKSQSEFVGRAGLTHQTVETVSSKQQEQSARRNFARSYVNEITKEAIFTDRKRNELLKQWPMIFHEMVYSAVGDMTDMPGYMKKCLEDLEKS